MTLTPKQKAVFEYIKNYIDENSFSPTFEEIAYNFKYKSKGTVYKHIKALKLKGLIRQEWNRVRSIQLTDSKTKRASLLPLKGEWQTSGIKWHTPKYELVEIPADMALNNSAFILKINTPDLKKHFIITDDQIVVQPAASKHCTGYVIVKGQNSNLTLYSSSWNRHPERILGQISGIIRKY